MGFLKHREHQQRMETDCTYRCVANRRLILATCSLLGSMLSSFSSMLCFLLLGLMGGGAVLWLLTVEDMGCILDSPRSAASPACKHNIRAINSAQSGALDKSSEQSRLKKNIYIPLYTHYCRQSCCLERLI